MHESPPFSGIRGIFFVSHFIVLHDLGVSHMMPAGELPIPFVANPLPLGVHKDDVEVIHGIQFLILFEQIYLDAIHHMGRCISFSCIIKLLLRFLQLQPQHLPVVRDPLHTVHGPRIPHLIFGFAALVAVIQ